jgi:hypothetical protein
VVGQEVPLGALEVLCDRRRVEIEFVERSVWVSSIDRTASRIVLPTSTSGA